jgi:hypothetical protein
MTIKRHKPRPAQPTKQPPVPAPALSIFCPRYPLPDPTLIPAKGVFAAISSDFANAAVALLFPIAPVPPGTHATSNHDSNNPPNLLPCNWTDPGLLLSPDSRQLVTNISDAINTHHCALGAIHPNTGDTIEYPKLLQNSDGKLWEESCSEEMGRLTNGCKKEANT